MATAQQPSATSSAAPNWVINATLLWERRSMLLRVGVATLVISLAIAFLVPKRYESTARIMPPEPSGSNAMMLSALAGRAGGGGLSGLAGFAGNLFGIRNTSAVFVELLHSGTISGHIIDRYNLQKVYGKKYRIDTAKTLAHRTSISDDKKTGVITITVSDRDRQRARDLAQAYLDELNQLVVQTNTSSARQERRFIEKRLASARADLEQAQVALSDFSSTHAAIDIKEQTRATVETGAKLQAEILVEESNLAATKKIYGDSNIRVRTAEARIAELRGELKKIGGDAQPLPQQDASTNTKQEDYPSLRQIPRLAVPYADLFRRVKTDETIYELLTQQYELARIQEAKDVPVVSVIDAPGIPEKKAFPPRLLLALGITFFVLMIASASVLVRFRWQSLEEDDPRRGLALQVFSALQQRLFLLRGAR